MSSAFTTRAFSTLDAGPADTVHKWDFYGFKITLHVPSNLNLDVIEREFQYFDASSGAPDCQIEIAWAHPDYSNFPFTRSAFSTPRNFCYLLGKEKIIDYSGKALLVESAGGSNIRLTSADPELIQAIVYTVILFQTGRHFDRLGRYRVHALGISYEGRGALVLLPMGGGKSTLLLRLLKENGIELLSEDTPLVDRSGTIYPFPIKLGVLPGEVPDDVPPRFVRHMRHLEGAEKEVIDLAYFQGKIRSSPAPAECVIIGERYLGIGTKITPVFKRTAFARFFRDCVIGLGVYQGLEFALRSSPWELWRYVSLAMRRARACLALVSRADCFEFRMGSDLAENSRCLHQFLAERGTQAR